MLTKRQNLLETIHGGNPDRYVNQYEFIQPMVFCNPLAPAPNDIDADGRQKDDWGVWWQVSGQPGRMPLHDAEHRVVTDITKWKDQVTPPTGLDNPGIWEPFAQQMDKIDGNETFRCAGVFPGIWERLHHLCEITTACMNLMIHPKESNELLDCIEEYEMNLAEAICKYVKPDALFHHDDWGTQESTFMSDDMFKEFILPRYQRVYGYYKDHGVELIVHHSDTWGESLVPHMIEMGIDIWQGALFDTQDIQKLVDNYGDKITIMGGIEDAHIDHEGWTQEEVDAEVDMVLDTVDRKTGFIPCLTHGLYMSLYDGVYDAISASIDRRSKIDFA